MTLGIMQPYIFPYVGYFQLVHSVDRFVMYDDVAYIKQGWINRNKILLNGKEHVFTIPLKNASSFTTIADTELNMPLYEVWRGKFMKTLAQAYARAPHYKPVNDLIGGVLHSSSRTIGSLAAVSIMEMAGYLGIKTEFRPTATGYGNHELRAKDRVIDICKRENAKVYNNPIGGKELYDKAEFARRGIALHFVKSRKISYAQFNDEFVPWLSIIDILMFNDRETIMSFLNEYDLE